ncbi:MAG TPA: biotin/lipoyl-containing protein, partial [Candidatus Bathyarchaeia archaeon]|nr:biotin/lipoyl-containing protein [Candidatus Bathyarchaeia archaeon]
MSDAFAVRIPHEFVNDDTVKLLRWMVEDGQEVREGQTLAEIETSKAVVELAAGATGKISQKRKPGEELRVGEIVGFISSNGISSASFESAVEAATRRGTPAQDATESEKLPADTRFSKKALDLLQANALSPSLFSGRGLVRETDVIEHLKKVQEIGRRAAVTH